MTTAWAGVVSAVTMFGSPASAQQASDPIREHTLAPIELTQPPTSTAQLYLEEKIVDLWSKKTDAEFPSEVEMTPEIQTSIQKGLEYLKSKQLPDGSWEPSGGYHGIADTALAGLAFLANGATPTSGPYAENISKAMKYLLDNQDSSGLFTGHHSDRPMFGHGYSMLFLAHCYGMSRNSVNEVRLRSALQAGVQLIAKTQSRTSQREMIGGWYYSPHNKEDEGAVTVTQIQALRAAREAGIYVPKEVIDQAVDYIQKSQNRYNSKKQTKDDIDEIYDNGGIRYGRSSMRRSSFPLTCAGLCVLNGTGDYSSTEYMLALKFVTKSYLAKPDFTEHFHYTHFYLNQALHQIGGRPYAVYYSVASKQFLKRQQKDGSFPGKFTWHFKVSTAETWDGGDMRNYATAMSVLVLSAPYEILPFYTR